MAVLVPVVVVVVMVVAARAEALAKHRRADEDDEQPRDEREPRVELLRDDECGQAEGHESEREHAGGMRDRDRSAEEERMPRCPLRADEVRRDHRLPVPRREGMRGPQNAAIRSETRSTPTERSPSSMSASKPPGT